MNDKYLLIEKYHLKHENNAWYSERENSHKHLIFKDSFFERNDVLGLLFRINKLCMAKVKYFRKNIDKFKPMKYDYKKGFVSVPLWDADFLKHRESGYILDFRYLQTITSYDNFMALCNELEKYEDMNYKIRPIAENEYSILEDFLYEAIFIPEGMAAPPKEIICQPELQVYIKNFGNQKDDICLVAETDNKIIGAVWVRIMNDYGHIDDKTPSFAISLYKEYRHHGIGTALMKEMLHVLKQKGYQQASLSVQKENYAVKMYRNLGFQIVDENDEEYIMLYKF